MELATWREVIKLGVLFVILLLLLWYGARLVASGTRQIAESAATRTAVVNQLESVKADIIAEVTRSRETRLDQVKKETQQALDQKVETIETRATTAQKRADRAERKADGLAKKTKLIERVLEPVLQNPDIVPALIPALLPTPTPTQPPLVDTNPKHGGLAGWLFGW